MVPDGFIPLVKDHMGINHRLHIPEGVLYHPEFFVLERYFPCFKPGIGGQHPDAVKCCISLPSVPI